MEEDKQDILEQQEPQNEGEGETQTPDDEFKPKDGLSGQYKMDETASEIDKEFVEDVFPDVGEVSQDIKEDDDRSERLSSKNRLDFSSFDEIVKQDSIDETGKNSGSKRSMAKLSADLAEEENIKHHNYNYFIFTLAGKPIFCRFGDEFALSPMFATFSALIPKILSFYSDNPYFRDRNFLRCIKAKNLK